MGWDWNQIWWSLKNLLLDLFYEVVQRVIDTLSYFLKAFAGMLPDLQVFNITEMPGADTILPAVNWFLPIGYFIDLLGVYASVVVLYFTVGILTRWLKITN